MRLDQKALDKVVHALGCYAAVLTLLVLGTPWGGAVFVVAAFAVVWEVWRGWNADSPKDLVADAVGIAAAVLFWLQWARA